MTAMRDTSLYTRWESLVQQMDLAESCHQQAGKQTKEPKVAQINMRSCCMSYVLEGLPTRYNACDVCVTYQPGSPLNAQQCRMLTIGDLPQWTLQYTNPAHLCLEIQDSYNPNQMWSMCCDESSALQHSSLHHQVQSHYQSASWQPTHPDPYILDSKQTEQTRKCHKLQLRRKYNWLSRQHIPSLGLSETQPTQSVKGLACLSNRTLNLVVIDSRDNSALASNMGLKLYSSPPNSTAAIILDEQVCLVVFNQITLTLMKTPPCCDISLQSICVVLSTSFR